VAKPERGAEVTDVACGDRRSNGIAAKTIARRAPKPKRTCVAGEPIAGDELEGDLNPVRLIKERWVPQRAVGGGDAVQHNLGDAASSCLRQAEEGADDAEITATPRRAADFDHHHHRT
jgi:hypothetical protein